MRMIHHALMISAVFCLLHSSAVGQNSIPADTALNISSKEFSKIAYRTGHITDKMLRVNAKALIDLNQQKDAYNKALSKVRTPEAAGVKEELAQRYEIFSKQLSNISEERQFIPGLDTLKTALLFLHSLDRFQGNKALQGSLSKVSELGAQFQKAAQIEQFLDAQKALLLGHLGLVSKLGKLNQIKQKAYYYKQQVSQLKDYTKNPKRIRSRVLYAVQNNGQFKSFMNKHSMLSSFFRMSGADDGVESDSSMTALVNGMQTKKASTKAMEDQFGKMGQAAMQQVAANMDNGKKELDALRSKVSKYSQGGQDADMPDFRPNTQKTKSFFKRVEFAMDLKSAKGSGLIPVSTEITLTVGYKINDRSVIGIGGITRVGWGSFKNIQLSNQGIGIRSFVDWKLIKTTWISGGYEITSEKQAVVASQDLSNFKVVHRGLVGITEKLPVGSKLIKNSRLQLLIDVVNALSKQPSNPFIFRIGYNL